MIGKFMSDMLSNLKEMLKTDDIFYTGYVETVDDKFWHFTAENTDYHKDGNPLTLFKITRTSDGLYFDVYFYDRTIGEWEFIDELPDTFK
jgi:hypothetical protein